MNNVTGLFRDALNGMANSLNCMMLGKITAYNSKDNTATIEPMHYVPKQNIPYQPLINVPIGMYAIGGYNIKVRPTIGDLMIVLFCDYDIDNLMLDSKTKKGNTDRTHALEDAIALPLSINFLNNNFDTTEDLTITRKGTNAYVKIKSNGEIVLNSSKIKLGENANKRIAIENGYSSKVYAE